MKSITVMLVYDDDHGNVKDADQLIMGLAKAAITIIRYGKPNLDDMANITALRSDDGELLGTITRS